MFKKFQTGIFGRMERAQNIKEDQQFISISKDKDIKVAQTFSNLWSFVEFFQNNFYSHLLNAAHLMI